MSAQSHGGYYLPSPSYWPVLGSSALLGLTIGGALFINHVAGGGWILLLGFALLVWMLFGWFGQVIGESEKGLYNKQVDVGFRWSMSWFIFSEVMFFSAFFGALYYVRTLSVPDLAVGDNGLLWPGYTGGWPTAGPGVKEPFEAMAAWGIPAWNTAILLTSGVTVTFAHWALKKGNRGSLVGWMLATVALGATFLGLQAYEYHHAYTELGLTLGSGVYGSTFFMLTGFHGFHVTLGTIMLIVISGRCMKGHFKPESHFAFEAVSWYWHFVDVVWLGLFIFVYWL